jgi:CO/xanthine dehydrogenase FAD-binding subunit
MRIPGPAFVSQTENVARSRRIAGRRRRTSAGRRHGFLPRVGRTAPRRTCGGYQRGQGTPRHRNRPGVRENWRLKAAAHEIGSVQIQNRGTVAGNLCNASPAADGVPPLLVLNAEVELASAGGRRQMPLSEFITGNRKTQKKPDEILAAVLIPRQLEDAASVFVKLGARKYLVISISMVAAVVSIDIAGRISHARIAVGSCSTRAQRLQDLEKALVGMEAYQVAAAVQHEHLRVLTPIDDVRATAEYRRDASLTLVKRALQACIGML